LTGLRKTDGALLKIKFILSKNGSELSETIMEINDLREFDIRRRRCVRLRRLPKSSLRLDLRLQLSPSASAHSPDPYFKEQAPKRHIFTQYHI
jgi:hypothetical protein